MRFRTLFLIPAIALAACSATVSKDGASTSSASSSAPAAVELPASSGVDIDHSSVSFMGKSNIINHTGTFQKFSISFIPDATTPDDLSKSTMNATIDITSVKTDSAGLDGHFQKEDFFDTANYPLALFRSSEVKAAEDGTVSVTGDLTMKGITKTVTFAGTRTEAGLTLTADVPRRDFGIAKDSYKDKILDPMVPVTVDMVFAK